MPRAALMGQYFEAKFKTTTSNENTGRYTLHTSQ